MDEKPKHRTRQSPIDFVVPMQLEACVHQIGQGKQSNKSLMFQITSQGEDDGAFTALLQEGDMIVEAQGTVRRWQGTSTRFEGTINLTNFPGNDELRSYTFFLLPIFFAGVLIAVLMSWIEHLRGLIFAFVLMLPMIWIWGVSFIQRTKARNHFIDLLKQALQS
jgi:hypothetical protein